MNKSTMIYPLLAACLFLAACDGSKGGGGALPWRQIIERTIPPEGLEPPTPPGEEPPTGSSNWDELIWDQDDWT